MTAFRRITVKPEQMGGVPCIRGLRIPVATVVGMVADGMTEAAILEAYPDHEAEDIEAALRYAAEAVPRQEGHMKLIDRIVVDPAVMLGKPVIRGTRIPVAFILRKLAEAATREE